MMTKEQRERLEAMCDPAQNKWDLSPNDVSAIAGALADLDAIAELEAENARLAKYVLNSGHRAPDYACSACVPGGRINVPGFACTWHAALARIDALRKEGK